MKWYAYLLPFVLILTTLLSFHTSGWLSYCTLILAFGFVGLFELFLRPNIQNPEHESERKQASIFRNIQLFFVLLHWLTLLYFFYRIHTSTCDWPTLIGRISSMGLLCGIFGINLAHELGHHSNRFDQWVAKCSLLTALYMHFFIEHNKGHHKLVATPHDPASAYRNQSIYNFYVKSITGSLIQAWQLEKSDTVKKHGKWFTIQNTMIQYLLIELCFITLLLIIAGIKVMLCFLFAAAIGILLLESVNYIQHYGLSRQLTGPQQYERTQIWHSWDCHYPLGRLLLFELSRHSDHHYLASRPYQILRYHAAAPELPTGYPGSILMALFPPWWFAVMNKRIEMLHSIKTTANDASTEIVNASA